MLGDRRFDGLVLRFSRGRAWLALAGALVFVALGVWIMLEEAFLTGLLVVVTFGVFALLGIVNLARGTGRLVLGEETIAHLAAGGAVIMRWDDVTDVEEYDIRGTTFLGLHGPAEAHGMSLLFAGLGTRYGDLAIAPSAVGVDGDWLERTIRRCIEDPAARREVAAGRFPAHPSG